MIGFMGVDLEKGALPRNAKPQRLRKSSSPSLSSIITHSRAEEMSQTLKTSNSSGFAPFAPDGRARGRGGIESGCNRPQPHSSRHRLARVLEWPPRLLAAESPAEQLSLRPAL